MEKNSSLRETRAPLSLNKERGTCENTRYRRSGLCSGQVRIKTQTEQYSQSKVLQRRRWQRQNSRTNLMNYINQTKLQTCSSKARPPYAWGDMIHPSVSVPVSCASSACTLFLCVPRHQEIREVLREARRSGQSSVAPRRRADWRGLVCPFRCNVVAGGAGGGTFRGLVLQRNEVRDLREHRDCSQFLRGICSVNWKRARGAFQRSNDICVVFVVDRDTQANDR